jgi:hypothetical protein
MVATAQVSPYNTGNKRDCSFEDNNAYERCTEWQSNNKKLKLEEHHTPVISSQITTADFCSTGPIAKIVAQRNEGWIGVQQWDGVGKGKGKMRVEV